MYIAIGIAAALFTADRVLKYLSRTGKLRYEGRLLRLTHLENHGFFMSFGQQHPQLVRWMPWVVWLLAAACLLPQLSRRPFAAQLGISLVLSGGVSNQYDRLRRGSVTEFGGLHAAGRRGSHRTRPSAGVDQEIKKSGLRPDFLFLLVVQPTMAVAFKVRIGDLVLELPAHTPVLLCPGQAAGAIPPCPFQALPDGLHDLPVVVQAHLHRKPLPYSWLLNQSSQNLAMAGTMSFTYRRVVLTHRS